MNVDIPNLVKTAVPESKGRNVRIISDNRPSHRDPGFLSKDFPRSSPKLYITAESDDFDELTLAEWRDEGFDVEYIPMGNGGDEYRRKIRSLSKRKMDPCATFGIVAYGDAAGFCMEHYHIMDNNPEFKLGLLIAYYPSTIPDPEGRFPSGITTLVHFAAGEEIGVIKQTQMVGIQGKRRTTRKKVESGIGTGGSLNLAFRSYTYEAVPGFAEHDLEDYDRVRAELAWSRSLEVARSAFAMHNESEHILEENIQGKFFAQDLGQTMSGYAKHKSPHVTYVPTLTGGVGANELQTFYSQYFATTPSMKLTLLSRTIGADRVVDEVHVRFKHTREVPWILPGVPPTKKRVEVVVVSIVVLRGGKLYHEHVYWDQASVLVQVGLLDPDVVPEAARKLGVRKLPVVGREAAWRLLNGGDDGEDGEADNMLIPGWDDGEEDEQDDDEEDEEEEEEEEAEQYEEEDEEQEEEEEEDEEQEGEEHEEQDGQNGTSKEEGNREGTDAEAGDALPSINGQKQPKKDHVSASKTGEQGA